ncbi:MAG: hypothetical protein ACD_17C00003G0003 [uncultured bacterium]|nr:MAG: hypothetical protein ACD_17C00003G0003 [uncultured bacterium]OGN56633.1 MAG: molecular chaperone DnaK [Chlamydiae bacterium RIFCSPHIGHO2_01_FULL_44_39]OGN59130.1 MAG: molecular chaperone DnaK [Chlamydiae bacterium RIFCSPHIGHO2_02_FULL_45_9]OGN61141.1 MAG: molecular chaperone DnaK [Chlamydiae bacterium RIFCSPHIGHO2_12_FULL_44_59]OGN65611.1 MAG: molecular chaperone DnaK [Chlamydiae bacterium RIFCSPLOWO2_01_FULL_44_52]OGN68088.1 MAG: molecular chaperone DnaK [Chlamydiae bacterium RIFCSPLO
MNSIKLNKLFYPFPLAKEYFKAASETAEWKGRIVHVIVGIFEYLFSFFDNALFKRFPAPINQTSKAENLPPIRKKGRNIIGIDLGTTNSCVAIVKNGVVEVIPSEEGDRTIPSIIAYKGDQRLVGAQAKAQAEKNPSSTLYSTKRFMGRKYEEVATEASGQAYKVIKNENDEPVFEINGQIITPEAAGAQILAKIKSIAGKYLGEEVRQAVITVPAYFNDAQRQATRKAGQIAGLDVLKMITEPTAASLAYGIDKTSKDQNVVVYDLGGGTLDVSILNIADGIFEVRSTNGDTHLGGDDFDHAIVHWMVTEFKKHKQVDLSLNKVAMERLRDAAVKAKIELSNFDTTHIDLSSIITDSNGPKNLSLTLSRNKLEEICRTLIERTLEPCRKALADAKLLPTDIDQVILVGGMTRMPAIQGAVKDFFDRSPSIHVNPDEAVAIGAAIQGAVIGGDIDNVVLIDVTPLTLGIEVQGGLLTPLINRNTSIPVQKSMIFSTTTDNQSKVELQVFQGEKPRAQENKKIGTLLLDVMPAPQGVPKIKVTFCINGDGMLEVTAADLQTGKKEKIKVRSKSHLPKEEL